MKRRTTLFLSIIKNFLKRKEEKKEERKKERRKKKEKEGDTDREEREGKREERGKSKTQKKKKKRTLNFFWEVKKKNVGVFEPNLKNSAPSFLFRSPKAAPLFFVFFCERKEREEGGKRKKEGKGRCSFIGVCLTEKKTKERGFF